MDQALIPISTILKFPAQIFLVNFNPIKRKNSFPNPETDRHLCIICGKQFISSDLVQVETEFKRTVSFYAKVTCVFLAYNKQLRNSQKQTLFEWVKKTYFWSLKITLTARVPVLFIFLRVRRSIYLPAGVGYFCIKSTAKSMITRLSLCVSRSWTRHFVYLERISNQYKYTRHCIYQKLNLSFFQICPPSRISNQYKYIRHCIYQKLNPSFCQICPPSWISN